MNSKKIFYMLSLVILYGCQLNSGPKQDAEDVRDFASALYNNQLYAQSVAEYNYYLDNYDASDSEAANINYTIANIYFERVRNYEKALNYLLKIKHFYPESNLIDDVNKKMVECLERLERSTDAQQVLEESVLLDTEQSKPKRPGAVIAKIGKRSITTGDLAFEISQLPPYIRAQFDDKSKKADFLRQFIATELFYDSAKRQGLDKDKAVIEGAFQSKKNLMVQKLLEEKISENVNVTESDVELYYKANREKYTVNDKQGNAKSIKPFDEVRTQVMQDLILEKQKEAYELLVQRMMRAEAVEIYDDKL